MNDHLFVAAIITPKPEHFEDARLALLGILPQTRAEPGCVLFDIHTGIDAHKGELILYEEWVDEAALEAHYAQDYTKQVFENYQQWLAKDVMIIHMHKTD